jgi:hypothetical protein
VEALQGHGQHASGHGAVTTADQAAEDLLGQVRDLLADGAPPLAVGRALEVEGYEVLTARGVLRDLAIETDAVDESDLVCGIDTAPLRAFLRQPGARLLVDDSRAAELIAALSRHGLSPSTAAALVAETASHLRRSADVHVRRLRKVAVQGMAAGGVFTLFFASSALRPNYDGRVDAVTAAMTLLLTGYSWLLYRRNRVVD